MSSLLRLNHGIEASLLGLTDTARLAARMFVGVGLAAACSGCTSVPAFKYGALPSKISGISAGACGDATALVDAARLSVDVLDDPTFRSRIERLKVQDIDHRCDGADHRKHNGAGVYAELRKAQSSGFGLECKAFIVAVFYRVTVAWEGANDPKKARTFLLNCTWHPIHDKTIGVGTIVHELVHVAYYWHYGQARKGNACTVPNMVSDLATWRASEILAARGVPIESWRPTSEACSALVRLYETEHDLASAGEGEHPGSAEHTGGEDCPKRDGTPGG